ncbi:hypothetical protein GCM10022222_76060 [Amycolatopsis ultiminotia]|uniref:SWIM-type domain-containing protein n=1 Tax=Amycolatopsis ultiminotia TaxID=543629 RepID=A0ABP6YAK2_9PSEU
MAGEVTARWSADRVNGLAPDPAAARAARGLAVPSRWSGTGASGRAVWGACLGSGKTPYRTAVEPAGPAFRCSCPSRKVPCKHVLGLLLLWSAGRLPSAEEPDWVRGWPEERAAGPARAGAAAARSAAGPKDPEAAAKRARDRLARVTAGAAEMRDWLTDRVAAGFAGLERGGGEELRTLAARMIDARAPGLASGLHRAADLVGHGRDWPEQLLAELSLLHLLAGAVTRLAELPAALADTVRTRVGFPVSTAQVSESGERVADQWLVTGAADEDQETLRSRRTWLRGRHTGRDALVLSFAPPGRALDNTLPPGHVIAGELAFYPGAVPLRALFTYREDASPASPPGQGETSPAAHDTPHDPGNREPAPSAPGFPSDAGHPTGIGNPADPGRPEAPGFPAVPSRPEAPRFPAATGNPAAPGAPAAPGIAAVPAVPVAACGRALAVLHDATSAAQPGRSPDRSSPAPRVATDPAGSTSTTSHRAAPDARSGRPPGRRPADPGTPAPGRHTAASVGGPGPGTGGRVPPGAAAESVAAQGFPDPADSITEALSAYREALAADPWLDRWPVLLSRVSPARRPDGWAVSDEDGLALPLAAAVDPWPLLAAAAEGSVTLAAEWTNAGLWPLTCWYRGGMVRL